ncbi:MAG: cupredoxin domain-containing protein [Gaiellaceae bacterium]
MKTSTILAGTVLAAALVVAGPAAARPAAGDVTTTVVKVSMYEMGFKLSKRIVPRGIVVFRVTNAGKLPHDFRIKGKGTPVFDPSKTATLKVKFLKPGKFTFICSVEGHASGGMYGKLTVR